MTPEQALERAAQIAHVAQGDPEAWHGARDDLYAEALTAIAQGHPHPAELAAAVLTTSTHTPTWYACS